MPTYLKNFILEFERYRAIGDRAIAQVSDDALNKVIAADGNSIGMLVRHISGNFKSRFSQFLETDGEKPGRNRDAEFQDQVYSRPEVQSMWREGWDVVLGELAQLQESDLEKEVSVRGIRLTVHEALSRSVAHAAYHVGQIVLIARILVES